MTYVQCLACSKRSNMSYYYAAADAASVTQAIWRCEVKVSRGSEVSTVKSPTRRWVMDSGLSGRSEQTARQRRVDSPVPEVR